MKLLIKRILSWIYIVGKSTYEEVDKRKKLLEFSSFAQIGLNLIVTKNFVFSNHMLSNNTDYKIIIGDNTYLDCIVNFAGGVLEIGRNCSFRVGTIINCKTSIQIGDNVFSAPNVFISDNDNHPISPTLRREMTKYPPGTARWKFSRDDVNSNEVIIGDNVWLGKDCFILKGVRIGKGSIVAANSVVTKSFPEYSIIAGNPAKLVKRIKNE
jgi:acetyltransferase-like isoleucine patch superfamily enzyme